MQAYFGSETHLAWSIMMAESGGNPTATHLNTDGSIDRGLMQINSIHGFDSGWLLTVDGNLQAALGVRRGQGWRAWSTYTNGRYLLFY